MVSLKLLRFPYFSHFHKRTMSIVEDAVNLKHGFKSFQVTWSPKNNWKFRSSKMQYIVVMNQLIVWLMWTINTYKKKFEKHTFSVDLNHRVSKAPNLLFFFLSISKRKLIIHLLHVYVEWFDRVEYMLWALCMWWLYSMVL